MKKICLYTNSFGDSTFFDDHYMKVGYTNTIDYYYWWHSRDSRHCSIHMLIVV